MTKCRQWLGLLLAFMLMLTVMPGFAGAADGVSLSGQGSEDEPYLINSADDWNLFAQDVAAGITYAGSYIELEQNISVSQKIGVVSGSTRQHPFKGIFNGNGKTITAAIADADNQGTALFCCINGATIENLTVAGTITGGMHAAAIVGFSEGTGNKILNCKATATVNGATHIGGILGHALDSSIEISRCEFSGLLVGGATAKGVFFGWGDNGGTKTVTDCFYKMADGQDTANLDLAKMYQGSVAVSSCYKTAEIGSYGTPVFTAAPENEISEQILFDGTAYYASCTVSGVKSKYTYTGQVIAVTPTVTAANGTVLAENTDYTISISPATVQEKGDYTLTVTGTGGYQGMKTILFSVADIATGAELQAALDNAQNGDTITLGADIVTNSTIEVKWGKKDLTLDLAGHTIDRGLGSSSSFASDGSVLSIANESFTLTSSVGMGTITGGKSSESAGGIAIRNYSTKCVFENVIITGNSGSYGGGVYVPYNPFTFKNCIITNNHASYRSNSNGGGIFTEGGDLTLEDCVVTGNTANGIGGGIHAQRFNTGRTGTLTVSGKTIITNNTVGGAANNYYLESGEKIKLGGALSDEAMIHVTTQDVGSVVITSGWDSAMTGSAPFGYFAADDPLFTHITVEDGEIVISSDQETITISDCDNGTVSADPSGTVYAGVPVTVTAVPDAGYHLSSLTITDASQNAVLYNQTSDTTYTFTMPDSDVTVAAVFETGDPAMTWSGLQAAIDAAAAGDTIALPNDITADAFATGPLTINKQLTLDLAGHTIDRALTEAKNNGCVIRLESGADVTLTDSDPNGTGAITGGYDQYSAGGIHIKAGAKLTMESGVITGNTENQGSSYGPYAGGVLVQGGEFVMNGGTISDNRVNGDNAWCSGAGVHVSKNGSFTMNGGTISDNTCYGMGAGVSIYGVNDDLNSSFTMNGGTITGNDAEWGMGGGVYLYGGTFAMTGGSVTNNKAGGVYISSGHFQISGSPVVTGNYSRSNTAKAYNVWIDPGSSHYVEVVGALAQTASLGITSNNEPYFSGESKQITSGLGSFGTVNNFLSDNAEFRIAIVNGEAALFKPYVINTGNLSATEFTCPTSAMPGETFTVTPHVPDGKVLGYLYGYKGSTYYYPDYDPQTGTYSFEMPENDVYMVGMMCDAGTLTVKAVVDSTNPADQQKDCTFTITANLYYASRKMNGTYDGVVFRDNTATITLKGGESKSIQLPRSSTQGFTYTVTAAAPGGLTIANDTVTADLYDSQQTAVAEFTFTPTAFSGYQMLLAGSIGVRFKVTVPSGASTDNATVSFTVSDGRTWTAAFSDAERVGETDDYWFTCQLNCLELADEITAVATFGSDVYQDTFSAMDYFAYVRSDPTLSQNSQLVALVNALQDYGYYMQLSGWTDNRTHNAISSPVRTIEGEDVSQVRSMVFTMSKDLGESDITDVKISLTLNAETVICVSVKPGEGTTILTAGGTQRTIGNDTYYDFCTNPIGPKNLGIEYSIVVETDKDTACISVSAMWYAVAMLNSHALSEEQEFALTAYYYYYHAAENYNG